MKTANRSSNKRESSYGMTGRAFNAEIDPLIAVIDLASVLSRLRS